MKTLIGSVNELEIPGKYDVITIFTVGYALDDSQLAAAFARLRNALADGGIIATLTVNVLTLRRLLAEVVKHWLLRKYEEPGWVRWGWSRSPAAIIALARAAGLRLNDQFAKADHTYSRRSRVFWRWSSLRRPEILIVFEHAG